MIKNLFAFTLVFLLVLSSFGYEKASAATSGTINEANQGESILIEDYSDEEFPEDYVDETALDGTKDQSIEVRTESSVKEGVITPLKTFIENGGVSRLDYMPGANAVNWSVDPDTLKPYMFLGFLQITKNGKVWKTYSLSGVGALGSSVKDTIELPGTKLAAGTYKFTLSGVASATTGKKIDYYTVSKNAHLTITIGGRGGR